MSPSLPWSAEIAWLIGALTLAGLALGWYVKFRPAWRRFWDGMETFFDTFRGRPESVDQTTGKVIEKVEPLGLRLGAVETRMGGLESAVEQMANILAAQVQHREQLDNHEARLGSLETGRWERIATHAENAQFYRLVGDEMGKPAAEPIKPPEERP